jgi:3-methyladenine DNA glycosylase AlkC
MAEPLKNRYGADVPEAIAAMICAVHPRFDADGFVRDALDGYAALGLMARGRKIAEALHRHLPQAFPNAVDILLASLDRPHGRRAGAGMDGFLFLPHTEFVAAYGLDHFEDAMRAQHALTRRFTAEFSIRPFLERHPQATLQRLAQWAEDPDEHVRRLVSEGTRPRLPWGMRLRAFQRDPRPTLALLEKLRDDPSLYVRRSVANHLNDIGKDHPDLLNEVAARWMQDAGDARAWIVRHALRSSIKRGDPKALALLGYGATAKIRLDDVRIRPKRATIGDKVVVAFDVVSTARRRQSLLIDFRVHYVKANGSTSPKVFKGRKLDLAPGDTSPCIYAIALIQRSTRTHYPGTHRVEALVNGVAYPLGAFELRAAPKSRDG